MNDNIEKVISLKFQHSHIKIMTRCVIFLILFDRDPRTINGWEADVIFKCVSCIHWPISYRSDTILCLPRSIGSSVLTSRLHISFSFILSSLFDGCTDIFEPRVRTRVGSSFAFDYSDPFLLWLLLSKAHLLPRVIIARAVSSFSALFLTSVRSSMPWMWRCGCVEAANGNFQHENYHPRASLGIQSGVVEHLFLCLH